MGAGVFRLQRLGGEGQCVAGGAGKPAFTPRMQSVLEQAGLCLSFPIGVFLPREGGGAGRKAYKKKRGGVCVFCKKKLWESAEDSPG